jgi:hypothetical protein
MINAEPEEVHHHQEHKSSTGKPPKDMSQVRHNYENTSYTMISREQMM